MTPIRINLKEMNQWDHYKVSGRSLCQNNVCLLLRIDRTESPVLYGHSCLK